jgi:hypothetical protein
MLQAVYGTVYHRYRIHLGTLPGDYGTQPFYTSLSSIYHALENHRGFTDFVSARYVDADFFIPNPGFIVECDESQHFTKSRGITLKNYPDNKKVGFSLKDWISRCDELDKHDNDPPSRDEQRAWYDTVRDFLPEIKGFQPTIRLYAGELDWCGMDPEKEEDRESFKKILLEHQSYPCLEIFPDPHPIFGRVIITGPWEGNITKAKALIEDVIRQWPNQDRVAFFITPGGFLKFPWPDDFPAPKNNLDPPEETLNLLRDAARKYCDQFLDEELRADFARHIDYLTIGIDSSDEKKKNGYQVEFVATVDLKTNQYYWTGKSYPDVPQQHRLIRVSDLSSHFILIHIGKVMVLGCHDLKMFSNRGRKAASRAKKQTWRKSVHQEIDQLVKREKPMIIVQHPHTTDRYGSWYAEWNELASHCPLEVRYISAGLYYNYGKKCRSSLADVRKYTRRGSSIDFILHLNHPDRVNNIITEDPPKIIAQGDAENKIPAEYGERYPREFESLIDTYRQMAGPLFKKGGTSSKENYIVKIKKTPPGVLYFFCYFPKEKKFSVELNVNATRAPQYESTIKDLKQKRFERLPNATFWEQKTKSATWLRLQFFYPEDTPPQIIVQGMFDLVNQTYEKIQGEKDVERTSIDDKDQNKRYD